VNSNDTTRPTGCTTRGIPTWWAWSRPCRTSRPTAPRRPTPRRRRQQMPSPRRQPPGVRPSRGRKKPSRATNRRPPPPPTKKPPPPTIRPKSEDHRPEKPTTPENPTTRAFPRHKRHRREERPAKQRTRMGPAPFTQKVLKPNGDTVVTTVNRETGEFAISIVPCVGGEAATSSGDAFRDGLKAWRDELDPARSAIRNDVAKQADALIDGLTARTARRTGLTRAAAATLVG